MTRQWKICAALLSLIAFAIAAQLAPAQKTAPRVTSLRVLYEQVTDVNVFPYQGLCCCRCGCCCSPPGLYSHSDESDGSGLGAGWGSRGESMLRFIRRSWGTKTRTQSSERGIEATGEQDHLQAAC